VVWRGEHNSNDKHTALATCSSNSRHVLLLSLTFSNSSLTGGGNFWLMSVAAFNPRSIASATSDTFGGGGVCESERVRENEDECEGSWVHLSQQQQTPWGGGGGGESESDCVSVCA